MKESIAHMIRAGDLRWPRCGALVLALVLAAVQGARADGPPWITNLGASSFRVVEDRFVYSLWESIAGRDLNGDGDTGDAVVQVRDASTGDTTNLGLAGDLAAVWGDWLVLGVEESQQGQDLNGDGDAEDTVVHIHDLSGSGTRNLGLASRWSNCCRPWPGEIPLVVVRGSLLVVVEEARQGRDLNGDGDTKDTVLHVHDLDRGETTNLGLASSALAVSESWVVMQISENSQGQDLNGDGDLGDSVYHVHDLATAETRRLSVAGIAGVFFQFQGSLSGKWFAWSGLESQQGADLNHDGDSVDWVVHVHDLSRGETRNWKLEGSVAVSGGHALVSESLSERLHLLDLEAGVATDLGLVGTSPLFDRVDEKLLLLWVDVSVGWTVVQMAHLIDLSTGQVTNLRSNASRVWGDRLFYAVYESYAAGDLACGDPDCEDLLARDLNGDGDTADTVLHVRDLTAGETTNLGLAVGGLGRGDQGPRDDRLVFWVSELAQGKDLNGDGDNVDSVLHVHDLATNETMNLGLSGSFEWFRANPPRGGKWLAIAVREDSQGRDLNGDGDTQDEVMHVHDVVSRRTTNLHLATVTTASGLALPGVISEAEMTFQASEEDQNEDLNGDGDMEDLVTHLVDLNAIAALPIFLRGDDNDDGMVDITDPVFNLEYQFLGLGEPGCLAALDTNADAVHNVTDPIYNLEHQFLGKPAPPPPHPRCGPESLRPEEALPCGTPPANCP